MKKLLIIIALLWSQINSAQTSVGDYFTYQGELIVNGQAANGNYEFEAQFYDAATNGNNIANNFNIAATVTNGIFTLQFDIGGGAFDGDEVWLELLVTPPGGGTQVSLLPRQLITNSPYSIQAKYVGSDGVSTISIENAAVTTAKIANGAVTSAKLAGDSVTSAKIANGTIATADIASQAVTRIQIAANTIQRSEVDSTQIQERVTGACAAGSSIRVIAQDGTVTCETDDVGASFAGWGLTGNAGTNSLNNFIGTTDNEPLVLKVNNNASLVIYPTLTTGGQQDTNIVMGGNLNFITHTNENGSIIAGGLGNTIETTSTGNHNFANTIVGGESHKINGVDVLSAIIAGGYNNIVSSEFASIIGGFQNKATNSYAAVVGGRENQASGYNSFATGYGSKANHRGSWVWNDSSDVGTANSLATTADNQFLIRAVGGVGIGTNTPASPLHIKGQGTTFGSVVDEVVATIEPKTSTDNVSLAINRLASNRESALLFTTNKSPDFGIRSVNGQALDFNSFDNIGASSVMMRINDKAIDRIDINTNFEPFSNNTYRLGNTNFRWSTVFTTNVDTTNAVNVTSDRRLKDNIKEMDYGLAEILSMNPVTYSMKSDAEKHTHMGLIAQEVETIIPEIVSQKDDGMHTRSLRYSELIPVLIKATQQQQTLIEQQAQQIKDLKSLVNDLLSNNKTNK